MLPTVSFGGLFDKAYDLLERLGGPDMRSGLTESVAGDIGKAMAQASAWENAGRAMVGGQRQPVPRLPRRVALAWGGAAAESSRSYSRAWIERSGPTGRRDGPRCRRTCATPSSRPSTWLSSSLMSVMEMVAIAAAGFSYAVIPIFGQVELVRRFGDVVRLLFDAKKVVAVFWNFLVLIKDSFVAAADLLTGEPLPPAPALPARAA